jgi:hypothetical protein
VGTCCWLSATHAIVSTRAAPAPFTSNAPKALNEPWTTSSGSRYGPIPRQSLHEEALSSWTRAYSA